MASVAGDGQEALAAGMGTVGQACGACHKAHRQAEN
ncbi:cytochrome c [Silicimonas algicola]